MWRDLVELVRAPAALSVPGDVVAGACAGAALSRRTPALTASSVLLYWAGMAANDWADRGLDARERPERPIPSGRVSSGTAVTVAVGLTAAGVALAAWAGGRRALALAAPLAGSVWAYDLRGKHTWAGPTMMATCRGLDVLLGATAGEITAALVPAVTVAAHTYTVTALSRGEVHGARRGLPAATLVGTAAVALSAAIPRGLHGCRTPGGVPATSGECRAGVVRAGAAIALSLRYASGYGGPQLAAARTPSPDNVRAAVAAGIVNLPTLQGALIAHGGAPLLGGTPLLGAVIAAGTPLGRRLARKLSPT